MTQPWAALLHVNLKSGGQLCPPQIPRGNGMPKYLPKSLEPALPRFDLIINQHAQQLSESAEAKVSMADLCRLFQLRLDLADRFEAANPGPVVAAWLDPAWTIPQGEIPAAIAVLDQTRADYEAALQNPQHDDDGFGEEPQEEK